MPETDRLWATIDAWWNAIEVLIVTGVTNARTEAANTGIKQIKRTGRGYRNSENYRSLTVEVTKWIRRRTRYAEARHRMPWHGARRPCQQWPVTSAVRGLYWYLGCSLWRLRGRPPT